MSENENHQESVINEFVRIWSDPYLAEEIAQKLGCGEAEALSALLIAGGKTDVADLWLQLHSLGDEQGDEHFGLSTPNLSDT